jgi:hypothetical protein
MLKHFLKTLTIFALILAIAFLALGFLGHKAGFVPTTENAAK